MVANAWRRSGNTGASCWVKHFLWESFGILGVDRVGLERADGGFCSKKMMEYFEAKGVPDIVAARFHGGLKAAVRTVRRLRLKHGVEVCQSRHAFSARWESSTG